jgi:hypothetical protein
VNASYSAVQNIFSFLLLSNSLRFKIYKTLISPDILCGYETWSVYPSRDEYKLRALQNRVMKRICGPIREQQAGYGRNQTIGIEQET